jgi:hypothetical protein
VRDCPSEGKPEDVTCGKPRPLTRAAWTSATRPWTAVGRESWGPSSRGINGDCLNAGQLPDQVCPDARAVSEATNQQQRWSVSTPGDAQSEPADLNETDILPLVRAASRSTRVWSEGLHLMILS